jgi:hypothetical protein
VLLVVTVWWRPDGVATLGALAWSQFAEELGYGLRKVLSPDGI